MSDDDHAQRTDAGRPDDSIVIATSDPAIEAVVERRSDWMRHPFATIRLETDPACGPEPLTGASPWVFDLDAPQAVGARSPGRDASSSRPGHDTSTTHPTIAPRSAGPVPEVDEPCIVAGTPHRDRRSTSPRLRTRPGRRAPGAWYPAVVAFAGLMGGVIGSLGYHCIHRSRRRRSDGMR